MKNVFKFLAILVVISVIAFPMKCSVHLNGSTPVSVITSDTMPCYYLRKCTGEDIHYGYVVTSKTGVTFLNSGKLPLKKDCPATTIISIEYPENSRHIANKPKQGYTE